MNSVSWKKFGIPVFLGILLILAGNARAAYLFNVHQELRQPNGEILKCLASGDEFYNWLHDAAGYTIIQDPKTGWYVYAEPGLEGGLKPSALIAGRTDPRKAGLRQGLRLAPKKIQDLRKGFLRLKEDMEIVMAPRTGAFNNLAVFIRFQGESEFTDAPSVYTDQLNASGASANSMYNYFREASYTTLSIATSLYPAPSTTIISYQDAYARGYYQPYNEATNTIGYQGGNNGTERRDREHTLIKNAVASIAAQVPAGLVIDGDGDGRVDNITFVALGTPTGWSSLLWPHQWALYSQTVYINGKRVYTYSFHLQSMFNVGVLSHEMFHCLGSPDLYHYTSDGIRPVGGWDVMESNANPPQHMGAYMKWKYGTWIASIPEITSSGTYTLQPLTSSSGNSCKIRSPNSSSEYFVVEYRRRTGTFESSLPGEGLLVYRINTAEVGNADGPPDEVYIYRPDGTLSVNGTVNNAALSSGAGRTAINDATNPSSFLFSGSPGGLDISSVGAAGATISFYVTMPASPAGLTVTSPNGGETWVGGSSRNITWTTSGTVANVMLEYSTNSGTNWTTIAASTANTSSFAWTVPDVSSSYCLVRVSAAGAGTPADGSNAMFTISGGIPTIGLSRKNFNFGAIQNGTATPAGMTALTNTSAGTLTWTATRSNDWILVSPPSGTGPASVSVGIARTDMNPGTYQGTIMVADPNASNTPQFITVNYQVFEPGWDNPPFGAFETPAGGATVASSIPVTGWALDDIGMQTVKIYRGTGLSDRIYIGDAVFVEGARPDVEAAYQAYPQNSKAGWGYMLLTNFLPNGGNGNFNLLAYATDLTGHEVLLGSKAITCNNAGAVLPFGAIDTPTQGGMASGSLFYNFGWALTPMPNSIPTDGSTINVWVDGAPLGHPSYNHYRADIATLFPGYANANAAIGVFNLNTTTYANAVHTIAWSVTDSAGNVDGIGSRYFTIQNAPGAPSPGGPDAKDGAGGGIRTGDLTDRGLPIPRSASEIAALPENSRTPVFVKQGMAANAPVEIIVPEGDGSIRIAIPEVTRVAVYLNEEEAGETEEQMIGRGTRILDKNANADARYQAFELALGQLKPLPIGASFDPIDGVLYWQPGPGFWGEFAFVIVDTETMTKRTVKITIAS